MSPSKTILLDESRQAAATLTGSTLRVELITPGKGMSATYPAKVLEAAAKANLFPAGLHMYLDHPTPTEKWERPERSVRDLAAVLTEAGVWDPKAGADGTGAVVGVARVFGPHQAAIADMSESIGLSIRGSAAVTFDGAEPVVTEMVKVDSVDFVTKAGRGGRIVELLESAAAAPVEAAVARGVAESTANATREALQKAARVAHGGEGVYVWVRDFDESNVWYEVDAGKAMSLWQEPYALDADEAAVLSGSRVQVRPVTTYVPLTVGAVESQIVPVIPAGRKHTPSHSQEENMANIQIDEAEHSRLVAEAGRVTTLENDLREATTRATTAEARAAGAENRAGAVELIGESGTTFTGTERRGLLADLPVTESGALDREAFKTRLTEAITEKAAAAGAGTVRGFGGSTAVDGDGLKVREASDAARARAFGRQVKEA